MAEGGAKIFGIFRLKNHDFVPKNHIFSNFRGGRALPPLDPPLDTSERGPFCKHPIRKTIKIPIVFAILPLNRTMLCIHDIAVYTQYTYIVDIYTIYLY